MDGTAGTIRKTAIIVAGGTGKRMGGDRPKQFLPLAGKPMLLHTISAFHRHDGNMELVVALPKDQMTLWDELCREHGPVPRHRVVPGGAERFHSVKEGLDTVQHDGLVAVHDGARPLVDPALIGRCMDAAEKHGAAIPVVPVSSSVRQVSGTTSKAIDRTHLRIVQTPQCFQVDLLRKAFAQPYEPAFTDEATMVERLGTEVFLVAGEDRNIKVTNRTDMILAEVLLQGS